MTKLNYIDCSNVFALNPDMKINITYYEEFFPIITIDDFYLYPEKVRNLAFQIPITKGRSDKTSGYPGKRLNIDNFIDSEEFNRSLFRIFTEASDEVKYINVSTNLVFNIFDTSEPLPSEHYSLPHTDPVEFAALIYLNHQDESVPGTNLYKYKPGNLPMIPSTYAHMELLIKYYNRQNPGRFKNKVETVKFIKDTIVEYQKEMQNLVKDNNNHILEDTDIWEIHTQAEPKFNRFMTYMGGMFHSAAIDYDYFEDKDYVRINQVLFNAEKRDIG